MGALVRKKKITKIDEENLLGVIQQAASEIDTQTLKIEDNYNKIKGIVNSTDDASMIAVLSKVVTDLLKLNDNNITNRLKLSKVLSDHQRAMTKGVIDISSEDIPTIDYDNLSNIIDGK